jgi:5'(3')-deoxyribonucleotidase
MKKLTIYVDMDGVLADFQTAYDESKQICKDLDLTEIDPADQVRFDELKPMKDAVESFLWLSYNFEAFIATTSPWDNPLALMQKRVWAENVLGEVVKKKVITTHRKDLLIGDYLIDDREANGAKNFPGTLIRFGSEKYPDWKSVINYFRNKYKS